MMRAYRVADCPKNAANFPVEIRSAEALSQALNCAKLLHGRADIAPMNGGRLLELRQSFSTLKRTQDGISQQTFVRDILGDEVNLDIGLKILEATRKTNVGFFRKLETEITYCIANHIQGNPLTSFLHLYRSFEKIAVAFPLTYIAGQVDFEKSIERLRHYFGVDRGELSFAHEFAKQIATQSELLAEYKIKFSTQYTSVDEFSALMTEIKACCPGFIDDGFDVQTGEFDVEFTKVSSLVIGVRNRLFHFSNSGQRNIDIDKIGGVSELCRMMVQSGLHWLALAFDEVFRRQAGRVIIV